MKSNSTARIAGRLASTLILGALLGAAPLSLSAQQTPAEKPKDEIHTLAPYVISSTRAKQDPFTNPTSLTLFLPVELDRAQINTLSDALAQSPGVRVDKSGGAQGGLTSVFIRGSNSTSTLFRIDGVRINGENFTVGYNNFLGSSTTDGLDRIEILRGPQSTLYGSSAIGGVISLETARFNPSASNNKIFLELGSFSTIAASLSAGASAKIAGASTRATLSISGIHTDNDRPDNELRQYGISTRLEADLLKTLTLGLTYRLNDFHFEETGPTFAPSAGIGDGQSNLATLYADFHPTGNLTSHLTYAWFQSLYTWTSSYGAEPSRGTRNIIDWQNTWDAASFLQLIAGLNCEWSHYTSVGSSTREDLSSAYLSTVITPVKNLEFILGGRFDHYDTFGNNATYRGGFSYLLAPTNTKFRATIGTGFNAPDPVYKIGGPYYAPNPDIQPEKSIGWDAGIDQFLLDKKLTLSATYFQNKYRNAFFYESIPVDPYGRLINKRRTESKGVELSAAARINGTSSLRLAYTYLDARDSDTGQRLSKNPRHSLTADFNINITSKILLGAGLTYAAGRPNELSYDSSFAQISVPMSDYATARLYASWQIINNLTLKARIENLFNKEFDTVAGYPALPRAFYGSIEYKF